MDFPSTHINMALLKKLQQTFQKNVDELIDIFLQDAQKHMSFLAKMSMIENWEQFANALEELRFLSIDIGAVQFSHLCLTIEIATKEYRYKRLPSLMEQLEKQFITLCAELEALKTNTIRA